MRKAEIGRQSKPLVKTMLHEMRGARYSVTPDWTVPLSAPPYAGKVEDEEAARNLTQAPLLGRRCACLHVWKACWAS
jgi:hypothetical protein